MNLTADFDFAIDDINNTQQHTKFHGTLIRNHLITDLLKYIVREINKFVGTLYHDGFLLQLDICEMLLTTMNQQVFY
jgi:hypothetical protein